MAILVTCPSCAKTFRVKDKARGVVGKCPHCQQDVTAEGERVPDHDAFISYSQKDKAVADAACAALENRRIRCWIAPRDVPAGANWGSTIIDAIAESRVMVLVFSSDANQSKQVLREVTMAVQSDVTIVPFRIDGAPMSKDMQYFLAPLHWFDAVTPPLEGHLQKLASRVHALIAEHGPQPGAGFGDASAETLVAPRPALSPPVAGRGASTLTVSKRAAGIAAGVVVAAMLLLFLWPSGSSEKGPGSPRTTAPASPASQSTPAPAASASAPPAAQRSHDWAASEDQGVLTLPGGVEMKFEWIAAGTFLMGSLENEAGSSSDEYPQHEVTIAGGFWMGATEVTQRQWTAVMGNNPSAFKGDDLPVDSVSWSNSGEFIRRVNTGSAGTFRLPSEAEWEYACRAGTTTAYSFGDSETGLNEHAWYAAYSGGTTHPVGQKRPNAWGLYDMHGNVWEQCQDWFHNGYSEAPTDGSAWESPVSSFQVVRGGSWAFDPKYCRSAYRGEYTPDYRRTYYGFRLLRTPAAAVSSASKSAPEPLTPVSAPESQARIDSSHDNWGRKVALKLRWSAEGKANSDFNCAALSPDGKTVALGCGDGTIRFKSADSGQDLYVLGGDGKAYVAQVVYSAAGDVLAESGQTIPGSIGTYVRVWDIITKQQLIENRYDFESLRTSIAISPDGKSLCVVTPDGCSLYSLRTTGQQHNITIPPTLLPIFPVQPAFSPDGKSLALPDIGVGQVVVWDISNGNRKLTLVGHGDRVESLCYAPDGQTLVSGSEDGTIRVWDPNTGVQRGIIKTGHEAIPSIAYAPDGYVFASGSGSLLGPDKSGAIQLWNANDATNLLTVESAHRNRIDSIMFSANAARLISCDLAEVKIWDIVAES